MYVHVFRLSVCMNLLLFVILAAFFIILLILFLSLELMELPQHFLILQTQRIISPICACVSFSYYILDLLGYICVFCYSEVIHIQQD